MPIRPMINSDFHELGPWKSHPFTNSAKKSLCDMRSNYMQLATSFSRIIELSPVDLYSVTCQAKCAYISWLVIHASVWHSCWIQTFVFFLFYFFGTFKNWMHSHLTSEYVFNIQCHCDQIKAWKASSILEISSILSHTMSDTTQIITKKAIFNSIKPLLNIYLVCNC